MNETGLPDFIFLEQTAECSHSGRRIPL